MINLARLHIVLHEILGSKMSGTLFSTMFATTFTLFAAEANLLVAKSDSQLKTPTLAEPQKSAEKATFKDRETQNFLNRYVALVVGNYEKSLATAKDLQKAIKNFVKKPTAAGLDAARDAWKTARIEYSNTEAYRYYGGPIDHPDTGPEGFLNAWPVDESYIDYVKGQANSGIINNAKKYPKIDKKTLRSMNEKDGETNIATGYHAVEFLLWGQDFSSDGPGNRSFEDYVDGKLTNADRRRQYLEVVSELIVDDLEKVLKPWKNGSYVKELSYLKPEQMMEKLMLGMASLSFDEMAGERMMVALAKGDQENEQDCFSDFSLKDLEANQQGIMAIWEKANMKSVFGGKEQEAAAISSALAQTQKSLASLSTLGIKKSAKSKERSFDQLINSKSSADKKALQSAIGKLHSQARLLDKLADEYGMELNVQH